MNGKLVSQQKFDLKGLQNQPMVKNAPSGFAYRLFGMFHASGSCGLMFQTFKILYIWWWIWKFNCGCKFQI